MTDQILDQYILKFLKIQELEII